MSVESAGIIARVEFYWASKYEGDRDSRPAPPPLPEDPEKLRREAIRLQGELYQLRADLTDPRCAEIIAGCEGRQTIWRK